MTATATPPKPKIKTPFEDLVNRHMEFLGAEKVSWPGGDRCDWEIMTQAGRLTVMADGAHHSNTVFSRFKDTALAADRLPNEVTECPGKWNWHFGDRPAQECFDHWILMLARVLPEARMPMLKPIKLAGVTLRWSMSRLTRMREEDVQATIELIRGRKHHGRLDIMDPKNQVAALDLFIDSTRNLTALNRSPEDLSTVIHEAVAVGGELRVVFRPGDMPSRNALAQPPSISVPCLLCGQVCDYKRDVRIVNAITGGGNKYCRHCLQVLPQRLAAALAQHIHQDHDPETWRSPGGPPQ